MADDKPNLPPQNPQATSSTSAARPPHRGSPPLPPVLAFIVRIFDHWIMNWLHNVSMAFLTFDSLLAAFRARSDPWTIAFVVSAYVGLLLFFWSIRAFEKATPARKRPLMVAVCGLAMFLIALFSYRVASIMPFGLAVAIWVVAGTTIAAGFYAIFTFGDIAWNGKAGGENATVKAHQS